MALQDRWMALGCGDRSCEIELRSNFRRLDFVDPPAYYRGIPLYPTRVEEDVVQDSCTCANGNHRGLLTGIDSGVPRLDPTEGLIYL